METRRRKRAREEQEEQAEEAAAAPSSSSSSSSSSSNSSSSASAAAPSSSSSSLSSSSSSSAPPPFRGPAADSVLGERLIDVIGIVAAMGFAAEVSHCLYLCGETYRKGDKGATNDMIVRSLERQCGASAARAAEREDFAHPDFYVVRSSTQLMRAALQDDLPRVLQLVQLGAPLELRDNGGFAALHWACQEPQTDSSEGIVRALLSGKYEGRGSQVNVQNKARETPLVWAASRSSEGIVSLLLAHGARQELQGGSGEGRSGGTALHLAARGSCDNVVKLLCAAPGAAAALALRDNNGRTPLAEAIRYGSTACAAVLRAHGALE